MQTYNLPKSVHLVTTTKVLYGIYFDETFQYNVNGGGGTYIYSFAVISKQDPTDPTRSMDTFIRNYDSLFSPKGYPFHWPATKLIPTLFTHLWHTPSLKIDPKH